MEARYMNSLAGRVLAVLTLVVIGVDASSFGRGDVDAIDLANVSAMVTAAKLLKNGDLDIYLAFTNKTGKDLWIIPGMSASASDDQGNSYSLRGSTGFARQSQSLKPGPDYGNVYLRLPPNVPTNASLQFHASDLRGSNIQSVSFKSSLTVLRDLKERVGYDTSIAVVDYKIK
jgi:hypothetical protein